MQQPEIITGKFSRVRRARRRVRAMAVRAVAWRHGWLQLGGLTLFSVGLGWVHPWIGFVASGVGLMMFGVAQELSQ